MKTVNEKTFKKIIEALNEESAYSLFDESIGSPEDNTEDEAVALMYDLDKEELFILDYAKPSNSWAETAESQNPWVHLGYLDGMEVIDGDPFGRIEEEITEKHQEQY